MLEDLPSTRDARLLEAALTFADRPALGDVVERLRPAFAAIPAARVAGLTIHDSERELARRQFIRIGEDGGAATVEQFRVDQSEISLLEAASGECVSLDLRSDSTPESLRALREFGAESLIAAPLALPDVLLGDIFVGLAAGEPVADADREYLRRIALIACPTVWNSFTHERFQRGDRRRDTLIPLITALNASMAPESIVKSAREALDSLESGAGCSVDLIRPDQEHYHTYLAGGSLSPHGRRNDQPLLLPLAGSPLEWLRDNPRTYESGDLLESTRFEIDAACRDAGIRRYVASPMIARGRVIGALFIGSTDPHPALRVDLWLYDTIALQVGLALENARQFRQLQEASERLAQQNVYLREEIRIEQDHGEMVGRSPALQRVRSAIARVARTDSTVLITGETGVGKELVARALHDAGPRADQPMVKVNCAAIPETMVESELFGHERGAFTSAVSQRIGRFELARDGTLFLDEIGELSPAVQAKLLRVLQDGEFERVGGSKTLKSNARIIAATNRELRKDADAGEFRSDLYYRLNVFPIHVPSLEERREDIPLLVEAFVAHFSRRMGKRFESIDAYSLERLTNQSWPGNIRQLRHEVERAIILCDSPVLRFEDSHAAASPVTSVGADTGDVQRSLRDVESEHILRVLSATGNVIEGQRGAAAILEINPSTLRSRIKRLNIERPTRQPR